MTKREKKLAEALARLIQACNARDIAPLSSTPDCMAEKGAKIYAEAISAARKILDEVLT